MTAVDRPDNGQDEGDARELDAVVRTIAAMYRDPDVARYAMNDLRDWLSGDREAPSTAVRAALRAANLPLASGRAGAGEQQRDTDEDCGHHSWTGLMALLDEHWPADIFPTQEDDITRDAGARIVSLLRWVDLLSGPHPDGEARQHRMDADCPCQPVQADNGAWDHQ